MAESKINVNVDNRLLKGLEYAVKIIEQYESDIRNSKDLIGIDLAEKGFCQGVIYKEALSKIGEAMLTD